MDIKKLQTLVFDALEDVKGQEIQIFDTTEITSLFDRVCVASGTSNRQTKALAASVRDKVKEAGGDIVGMEGEETGEWVLVDLGDMIVHIMQPAIRAYYRLEEIWGGKEVKMGAAKRGAKKVASDDADKPKRATRSKAAVEVTHDMMAIQTTVDDEEKKPARKPRVSKVAAELAGDKPARKPRATSSASGTAKIPTGGRVKVAASKTATASAKAAAAKKTTTRRKAAE
ncbi:ribosome silencing factor [Undibacterium cyanobacteriorum]|uniref:Ribosomal silencing factor RsfS n=1 Tax=Undibacterium cyanobacteriorum TaxID=3073561 RepID=A0ABY9RK22_9BURK|nr:ribosome silencing factor [Undibacterium sp. 20NA77.5]WMW81563.1 ribosome silencing factor [Undibacterium sp. 20NA77.5]